MPTTLRPVPGLATNIARSFGTRVFRGWGPRI
jgi:hypothetical protein